MAKRKLQVGDRVKGGRRGTEAYDEGRIVAIGLAGQEYHPHMTSHDAFVAWDSGVSTPAPLTLLRRL